MKQINNKIKQGCGSSPVPLRVGTFDAFINTMLDGPVNTSFSQAQLGAFDANYRIEGSEAVVTVTNDITINSALLHVFSIGARIAGEDSKVGRSLLAAGFPSGNRPGGRVTQTFEIHEPSPCR